jgi:hypothetical protein
VAGTTELMVLIQRFDYSGARQALARTPSCDPALISVLTALQYSLNFDFEKAYRMICDADEAFPPAAVLDEWRDTLHRLKQGHSETLLNESVCNMKIQLLQEEYADFLGRFYSFREELLVYCMLRALGNEVSLFHPDAENRHVKQRLESLGIRGRNVVLGLMRFLRREKKDEAGYRDVLAFFERDEVEALIQLRHRSIDGHRFHAVTREDIEQVYGPPEKLVRTLFHLLEGLGIPVHPDRYERINEWLAQALRKWEARPSGHSDGDAGGGV